MPEQQKLTTGQTAVGINFNPSNDSVVDQVKQKFAEILDIIDANKHNQSAEPYLTNSIYGEAYRSTMGAQMWVVKHLTWKH